MVNVLVFLWRIVRRTLHDLYIWYSSLQSITGYPGLKLFCLHNREAFYLNSIANVNPIGLLLSRVATPSPCTEFICDRNLCLPRSKICDGIYDCPDRTDEKHCGKF